MKLHRGTFNPGSVSILMLALMLALPTSLMAAECKAWIAQILSAKGQVEVVRAGASRVEFVNPGETKLCPGDTLRAGALSKATLLLANQTRATIDEATEFTLPQTASSNPNCQRAGPSNRPLLEILKGAIRFISRTPTSLEICAPYVNAAIEGTEFVVRAKPTENYVWVSEGRVLASNARSSLSLSPGEGAVARAGAALRRITVKPEDATQWSLYYPPVIDYRAEVYSRGPAAPTIAKAIADYRKADLEGAFAQLEEVPEASRNAEYYSLRAGLLLSIGRVEEALADTEQALRIDPAQGIAYALQSIVAVTQNKSEQAVELAKKAQQLDPESSVPEIALSYAHQARFDIEKARKRVRRAVELSPEDALAWSRLAELELSMGDLDEALAAAEKAEKLDPDLARTQTVLGFAHLTQIDIGEAKTAFRKAIDFDPAAPLPHLGLGLATIRRGDLDEGTKEIETAAILDPDNSLVRSYLGKAYYEQKRGGLAATELGNAKQLDPNDPTPWFYDAIRKQTANRPVEALHDIQKAIGLNDNRAVYRSRLLMDQDLAARSTSLGRIYSDLGFQERALVEGWKSVNTDPGNHSAHRLLADSYMALPRHEIARVSELLQSQLLQPLNITPLQPQLAESNLAILEGAGPSDLSFNEFNPLFGSNDIRFQASSIVGDNETFGDNVVLSGVHDNWSYSVGQFHLETEGFRENNNQDRDIVNGFLQFDVSTNTNLQAEARYDDYKRGDLPQRFDPSKFSTKLSNQPRNKSLRIGARHTPAPHSNFLASLVAARLDDVAVDSLGLNTSEIEQDACSVEFQYIHDQARFNVAIGGGYADISSEVTESPNDSAQPNPPPETSPPDLPPGTFLPDPPLGMPLLGMPLNSPVTRTDINYGNVYVYSNVGFSNRFQVTLGLSADDTENILPFNVHFKRKQVNPKLGFIWWPGGSTTIRSSLLRTLKRPLETNQTIEQTQVAGFNQFFDDRIGTDAWQYGVAIDQKISPSVFGGATYWKRKLNVPFSIADFTQLSPSGPTIELREDDWKEQFSRAYIYWALLTTLALRAEHTYEKFDRTQDPGEDLFNELKTHRTLLSASYNNSSGLITRFQATYIRQEGMFVDSQSMGATEAEDSFWVFKASVGYRFPKRRGIISLAINNLFNESFNFQDTDPVNPTIFPERAIFGRLTLSY